MSTVLFHGLFIVALAGVWLLIGGWLADIAHREWGQSRLSWLCLGAITDRHGLKIFYRWLGIILLPVIILVYIAALYHHVQR